MWKIVALNCTVVFDAVIWRATALWVDDDGSEGVRIEKTGQAYLTDRDDPSSMLLLAARDLEARVGEPASGRAPEAWIPVD